MLQFMSNNIFLGPFRIFFFPNKYNHNGVLLNLYKIRNLIYLLIFHQYLNLPPTS